MLFLSQYRAIFISEVITPYVYFLKINLSFAHPDVTYCCIIHNLNVSVYFLHIYLWLYNGNVGDKNNSIFRNEPTPRWKQDK